MLEQEEVIKEPPEQPIVVEALHPAAEQKPPDLLAHGSLEVEQQRIPLRQVWERLHVSMTLFRELRKRSITTD